MRREAERRVFPPGRRRAILGDGVTCILRGASEDYPAALQIVDLWHAVERLWGIVSSCLSVTIVL